MAIQFKPIDQAKTCWFDRISRKANHREKNNNFMFEYISLPETYKSNNIIKGTKEMLHQNYVIKKNNL